MILAKLFNLCEPKNYVGRIINTKTVENMLDNLEESLKKTVIIIIIIFFSFLSLLMAFWMPASCSSGGSL